MKSINHYKVLFLCLLNFTGLLYYMNGFTSQAQSQGSLNQNRDSGLRAILRIFAAKALHFVDFPEWRTTNPASNYYCQWLNNCLIHPLNIFTDVVSEPGFLSAYFSLPEVISYYRPIQTEDPRCFQPFNILLFFRSLKRLLDFLIKG